MARKLHYSQSLKFFWKDLYGTQKKLTPEFTDEQIYRVLKTNLLNSPLAPGESQEIRGLTISGLELWGEDSKGQLLHIFFLDKHLRNFLEETRLPDLEGIKKFLYENGEIKESSVPIRKLQPNTFLISLLCICLMRRMDMPFR